MCCDKIFHLSTNILTIIFFYRAKISNKEIIMNNILSSFITGFLSTAFLFAISVILVLGVKALYLAIKDFFAQKTPPETEIKKPPAPRRKRRKTPAPQRSIEIDPSEIDRIYVKKSS